MALLRLMRTDTLDHAFLKRYTSAAAVVLDEGEREGLFAD